MKSEKLIMRIDLDRKNFLEAEAGKKKRSVAAVVTEALDFYRTRIELAQHIRTSLKENWKRYKDAQEFFTAHVSTEDISSKPFRVGTARGRTVEDFIFEETYKALADWHRRGATPDALARVLETEYFISPAAMTAPLPFAEDEAPTQKQTVDTTREAKPKQTRKRIEATV